MPLSPTKAIETAKQAYDLHRTERKMLDVVRRYWRGRQRLPAVIPVGSPREVRVMAAASRVNVLPIIVNSLVQSSFVDGFRATKDEAANLEVWKVWQRNRMDARQTGIHRAAAAYGTAYAVVLPGNPVPVIRGASPRSMTAVYGEDPDWPMFALERLGRNSWRLYDEEGIYYLRGGEYGRWEHDETRIHNAGVTPVVRFVDEEDLDDGDEVDFDQGANQGRDETITRGQIAPLMSIQDQIDLTTFGLQIAQHYGAFKQRYIIGWAAETEQDALRTAASTLVTLDVEPESVKLGEWTETSLDGYIRSREASLKYAATLSQTTVHELTGELVNLSAEALAAAEAGKERKGGERRTLWGESHEQIFSLVGTYSGFAVPDDAQVVWRDTSARAFAATVDALGKIAQMLGVPVAELWERIPGTTQQDVQRWKAAQAEGDSFDQLTKMLDRQAGGGTVPGGAA